MKTAITKTTRAPSHLAPRQAASSNSNTRNASQSLTPPQSRSGLSVKRTLCVSTLTLSALTLALPITSAHAALTATTAKTIKGNPPALTFDSGTTIATDLDALLGFTMPDPAGGATPVEIKPTSGATSSTITAKRGVTFNQFTTNVTADGTAKTLPPTYYYDEDGDIPDPTTPVAGTLKATWTYQLGGTTKTVTAAELINPLTACSAPYTLTIAANGVKAQSQYGDPSVNNYGSKTYTYTVNINDYNICYAKPASMAVNKNGVTGASGANCTATFCNYASGYNSDVFEPGLGFIPKSTASAPTSNTIANFPTSGFDGANFTLVMSNSQSDYTYQSSDNGFASVDTAGVVTLNNGGAKLGANKTVTITATPNDTAFAAQTYSFTVKASQWARVKGVAKYNTNNNFTGTYPAAELCGAPTTGTGQLTGTAKHADAGKYFFKRSDFTSAPQANPADYYDVVAGTPVGTPTLGGYFSRDINGKFNDEWGNLWNGYASFGVHYHFWPAEAYISSNQFVVDSRNGSVTASRPDNGYLTVCR